MSLYIFGPIQSRRFGTSLGIDLSPLDKRCNFDCLYCELAPKVAMKDSDATFVVSDVIDELNSSLQQHPNVDVITLTANGEPTMYEAFDELVDAIKALDHKAKLLVLSNAALIDDKAMQKTLAKIDTVKLSLDAVTEEIFIKVDRPHPSIKITNIKSGIKEFAKNYDGELVIEILFVAGLNDTADEIKALNEYLVELHPHRIDIGTIDRPPAYGVSAVSNDRLDEIATLFDPTLTIAVAHRKEQELKQSHYTKEEIITTLDKRPLTPKDVSQLFDLTSVEILNQLVKSNEVLLLEQENDAFYILAKNFNKKRQKS
jgi:wyosine [tRNA(Phe)-imidazoG37] synthetase (radical SAM superfamily)